MKDYRNSLADNIRFYRKSCSMTQEQLGNKLGKTKTYISNFENGYALPNINTIVELAEIFDITLDELVGRKTKNLIV